MDRLRSFRSPPRPSAAARRRIAAWRDDEKLSPGEETLCRLSGQGAGYAKGKVPQDCPVPSARVPREEMDWVSIRAQEKVTTGPAGPPVCRTGGIAVT
jgi:hypothetical protein